MRPKKKILIWGAGEQAGTLRIVLHARGYNVEIAADEARLFDLERLPDVFLLIGFGAAAREALELALWKQSPKCGRVFQPRRGNDPQWMASLLQALRQATVRKRGPQASDFVRAAVMVA